MTVRMRRSIITDEVSQDFLRAVQVARHYRLDGVEIRSLWDKNPHELDEEEVNEVARAVTIPIVPTYTEQDLDDLIAGFWKVMAGLGGRPADRVGA